VQQSELNHATADQLSAALRVAARIAARVVKHRPYLKVSDFAVVEGIRLGKKVVGDPSTLSAMWKHEQGHYFQNLALRPMYLLVIATPSFYTETWATAWGN
jgi:hypothetical protein